MGAKKQNGRAAAESEQADMTLTGHLTELRQRITVAVAVLFIVFIACFAVVRTIADYVLNMGLKSGFSFVYLAPSELLTSYFKLSLVAAVAVASPVLLYEMWLFVAPALEKKQQRAGRLALLVGFFFFIAGVFFAYTVALPFMVNFLVQFNTSEYIVSSISVASYLNFVLGIAAIFGVIFEMPVLAFLLSIIGILKAVYMRKTRKYAILLVFVIAAIITPPDVVSQIMIAVPMLGLYEISILVCGVVEKRKLKAAQEEEREEAEDSQAL